MDDCHGSCELDDHIFCCHRFNFDFKMIYSNNDPRLAGLSDLDILLHFLKLIAEDMEDGTVNRHTMFVIVTWDKGFKNAARREWEDRKNKGDAPAMRFFKDHIVAGDIRVIIAKVNSKKYGSKQRGRRHCIIDKTNDLYSTHLKG